MDVRETSRPANRVAYNDPFLFPSSIRNKILIWHGENVDKITFDLVKYSGTLDVYYKITQRESWNEGFPVEGTLTTTSVSKTYECDHDDDAYDFKVTYGGSSDNREDIGPYSIYGVTNEEYQESKNNFSLYLILLVKFADAIYRRFRDGHWNNTSASWRPTTTTGTATMSADRLTHNFGATLTETPPRIYGGKKYPDANVTMPIYYWNNREETNSLIRKSGEFEDGIKNFINGISYPDLEAAYNAAGGGNPRTVRFNFTSSRPANFTFGPSVTDISIVLGAVTINGTSYMGSGYIDLDVTKNPDDSYTIAKNPTVDCTIDDVFDFNYFNTSFWASMADAPQSGAMIQCGFGQPGADPGAGQVALIRVDIDGTVGVGPFTKQE